MCCRRHRDDLPALVRDAREVVELAEAGAERLRSEHDGDRVDFPTLVQGAELDGQAALAGLEGRLGGAELFLQRRALLSQGGGGPLERAEPRAP